jgi:hypothetical protein
MSTSVSKSSNPSSKKKSVSKKSTNKKAKKEQHQLEDAKLFDDLAELAKNDAPVSNEASTTTEESSEPKISVASQDMKTADELVALAGEMYKTLKEHVKNNPEFMDWEDKKKLNYFLEKYNYTEFRKEFPIVVRYMICMGQYSSKAFRRFLNKTQSVVHPPPDKREKGYMEDQWVRRQADYVRYLWESYQRGHYNTAEAGWVWEDSYKKLKGEFDDFRDSYKAVETKTKEEKETFKAANAKDLLERLKTGQQTLSDADAQNLIEALKDKVYKRRFTNTLAQLLATRKSTVATSEGSGTGPEEEVVDKSKPTIHMVEHLADESRIGEVPEHMLLDEATAKKLPGFVSNLDPVFED